VGGAILGSFMSKTPSAPPVPEPPPLPDQVSKDADSRAKQAFSSRSPSSSSSTGARGGSLLSDGGATGVADEELDIGRTLLS